MSMWTEDADWRDLIKKADAYKAVGQPTIYLHGNCVFPWELVTEVEPGGGMRMSMHTGVRLTAVHPETGLQFDWSIDIESREANGKGHYEIDLRACRELMAKLPASPRQQLRAFFAECAGKVQEKWQEWQAVADQQKRMADSLHSLAILKD
jgi:hypothetical protein